MVWDGSGGWSRSLGTCTHVGDPEEAPGSWLRISIALAVVANWGVNQRMEDRSLSHFVSLSASPSLFV